MKVFIGPYKNYFGPFQLASAICFWEKEGYGKTYVYNFGMWLSKREWLNDFLVKRFEKKKRKIEVRIDNYDTWSMDNTLAHIILPMLKQLKAEKHGAPYVKNEDVPDFLRSEVEDPWETDSKHFEKWDWVLSEMIFAFECEVDPNDEDQFHTGEADYVFEPAVNEDGTTSEELRKIVPGPKHTLVTDYSALKAHQERKKNGFRLFGAYYENLWD